MTTQPEPWTWRLPDGSTHYPGASAIETKCGRRIGADLWWAEPGEPSCEKCRDEEETK